MVSDKAEANAEMAYAMRTVVRAALWLMTEGGYGAMRFLPYSGPTGFWRCEFHVMYQPSRVLFKYSASQGMNYLENHSGGAVPADCTPEQLGEAILKSVPEELKDLCIGPLDPHYASWLERLRYFLDQWLIPEAFHEFSGRDDSWSMYRMDHQGWSRVQPFPEPPMYIQPGEEPDLDWDIELEFPWQAAWDAVEPRGVVVFEASNATDDQRFDALAQELLRVLGVLATPHNKKHVTRAFRFAVVEMLGGPEQILHPPEVPRTPLVFCDLSEREGRVAFLKTLLHDHDEAGLLVAVNHVWGLLSRPRSPKAQMMAVRAGGKGRGKSALTACLKRFLAEAKAASAPAAGHAGETSLLAHIFDKYEAILDGKEPGPPRPAPEGALIQGPWQSAGNNEEE